MSAIRYRYRAGFGYGGFSGKARRNRDRARAARWDAERMLDEYADVEPPSRRHDRFIPIGRISEFLPSAGVEGSESGFQGQQRQLELPLRRPAADKPKAGYDRTDEPRSDGSTHRAGTASSRSWAVLRCQAGRVRPMAGLAYGCAIGSAAAATLLLVIRIAIL